MVAIKKKGVFALLLCSTFLWQGCDPPGPSALLRGERLIHDGKYQAAIESLREATTMLPNNPQAWNHLGLAYHWAGQYNQAVQAYRQAKDLNPNLASVRFNLGSLQLKINQPQFAANEFAAYTILEPKQVAGWVRRGMSEWRARNGNAAFESFQEALKLNPDRPMVWNSLGVIDLLYLNNPTGADYAFRQALQYKPDYAPAIYNAALVSHFYLPQEPIDRRPYALEKYREYLALQPTPLFTDVIQRIADQLDTELNPERAFPEPPSTNQLAIAHAPSPITNTTVTPPTPATNTGALVEMEAGELKPEETRQPDIAVRLPDPTSATPPTEIKVASIPPTDSVDTVDPSLAATVARNLNDVLPRDPGTASPAPTTPAVASPDFDNIGPSYVGLEYAYLNPPVPSTGFRHKAKQYFEEGWRLQKLRRWSDTIVAYRRAIQWDGSYFEAYHNLGLAAAANKDFLRAAVACETALALRPNSAGTRYNFATLLNGKGYYRDAAIELEKLLQQDADDVKSHLLLATIYDQQLHQVTRARTHYQRVLRLEPAHRQSTSIRYWLRRHGW